MRREKDRDAVGGETADEASQLERPFGVEPHHRLVEDEDARAMHEGRGQGEPLSHAVRERLRELARRPAEAELLEQQPGALSRLRPAHAVQAGDEAQELEHGELVVEEGMIRQIARHRLGGLGRPADVVPAEDGRPRRRLEEAHHHADRRRLAGAVAPEEAEDAARLDLEAQVVDGHERTVRLPQPLEPDHVPASAVANDSPPTSPARPRCRSGPPSMSFTWVASTGIWSNTASALTQRPSQSSLQAW